MDEVCEVKELGFSTITQKRGNVWAALSRLASSRCCTRSGVDLPPSLAILHRYHGMLRAFSLRLSYSLPRERFESFLKKSVMV
jgi:hypothetical protein